MRGHRAGTKRPKTVDGYVGEKVRLRRKKIGISQEMLGNQLGITFQQVQKYEKGINRIGASRLYDIAGILGVDVAHFFPERSGPADTATYDNAHAKRELIKHFECIDDHRTRDLIIDFVRTLASRDKP